jgi:hypothetical protein
MIASFGLLAGDGCVTTPSRQERPILSIPIQDNTLRENYVPFVGATIGRQVADAQSQLAQVCEDGREHYQLMHKLRQAANRFNHLLDALRQQRQATPSHHFVAGIRGIAQRGQ